MHSLTLNYVFLNQNDQQLDNLRRIVGLEHFQNGIQHVSVDKIIQEINIFDNQV